MALKSLFRRTEAPRIPAGQRVYAIGDIHGRSDLFDALLAQIEADNATRGNADTTIILLGDLVDRGADSQGVMDRATGWTAGWASLEALLGNHEASMLSAFGGEMRWFESWLGFGGRETLLSYGVEPGLLEVGSLPEILSAMERCVPAGHCQWLESLPYSLRHGDYLFVHAGIRPGTPLDEQEMRDLLWIREDFLDSKVDHGAMIVHGHSITEDVEERANRIGIDTGAYYTGKLTALGLEGQDRWYLQTGE